MDASLRLLPALGDEVLTEDLDVALVVVIDGFRATDWLEPARVVGEARAQLVKPLASSTPAQLVLEGDGQPVV